MRKNLFQQWLFTVVVIACTIHTVHAQVAAPMPLKDALVSLEKKYRLSILYRENLVVNKMAPPKTVISDNPDTALHTLLTPLGLTFKKISTTQIIISEATNSKETAALDK